VPRITYLQPDGSSKTVEVPRGHSVKSGAIDNLVPGIIGECGGACACATCHVYVDVKWWDIVGGPNQIEAEMLEFAAGVEKTSRLSCQIDVTDALDGLIVSVPVSQV